MNVRSSRVNQIDVALKGGGDGVGERADGLDARARVGKGGKIGSKEGVGLANVGVDLKPVPCRRDGGSGEAVPLKPGLDGGDALRAGRDKSLDLFVCGCVAWGGSTCQ